MKTIDASFLQMFELCNCELDRIGREAGDTPRVLYVGRERIEVADSDGRLHIIPRGCLSETGAGPDACYEDEPVRWVKQRWRDLGGRPDLLDIPSDQWRTYLASVDGENELLDLAERLIWHAHCAFLFHDARGIREMHRWLFDVIAKLGDDGVKLVKTRLGTLQDSLATIEDGWEERRIQAMRNSSAGDV
jgi:hypothetical protein